MRSPYPKSFGWSFFGHLAAVLLVSVLGLFRGLSCHRKPRELVLPIEFLVDTLQLDPLPPAPTPPAPDPDPISPPPPLPPPKETPKQEDPKKVEPKKVEEERKRSPIKISTNVVRKTQSPTSKPKLKPRPAGPKLTPEEIARLIDLGATASDRTVIPGEDERALSIIKNALHTAWILPPSEHSGRRPAQIEIRLDRFGNVVGRTLVSSSGNTLLDDSALRAANAVRQIRNLPAGFTDRFPAVVIEFELE